MSNYTILFFPPTSRHADSFLPCPRFICFHFPPRIPFFSFIQSLRLHSSIIFFSPSPQCHCRLFLLVFFPVLCICSFISCIFPSRIAHSSRIRLIKRKINKHVTTTGMFWWMKHAFIRLDKHAFFHPIYLWLRVFKLFQLIAILYLFVSVFDLTIYVCVCELYGLNVTWCAFIGFYNG